MTPKCYIGTSGYSYAEWVDAGVYPKGTPAAKMLDVYVQKFQTTELNYTWYQMPKAEPVERLCAKTPDHFKFAAKLTRTMTHEVKKGEWQKQAMLYRQGITPLMDAQKLLCILIQLPPYFHRTLERRNYLAALLDELAGLPLAIEFRHDSWNNDKVFAELERRRITLVAVDAPDLPGLFPKVAMVTNPDLFYVRFHGRNAPGWRSGSMQKQFNYDYTEWELKEWSQTIQSELMPNAQTGAIYFNNHVRGQAPKNALRLFSILNPGS